MKKVIFSISLTLVCVISILCCKNTSALRLNNVNDLGYYFICNLNENFGVYNSSSELYFTEEDSSISLLITSLAENNPSQQPLSFYENIVLKRFKVPNDIGLYGKYADKYVYYFNVESDLISLGYGSYSFYNSIAYLYVGRFNMDHVSTSNQELIKFYGFENGYCSEQLVMNKDLSNVDNLEYLNNSIFNNGYISLISPDNTNVYNSSQPPYSYGYEVVNEVLPQFISDYFYNNIFGGLGSSKNLDNSDIFNASYNNGYSDGLQQGFTNFIGTPRYEEIVQSYYNSGYDAGLLDNNSNWLGIGLLSLVDIPTMLLSNLFNYEVFGFNFYYLFLGLITLGVVLWLLKFFYKRS